MNPGDREAEARRHVEEWLPPATTTSGRLIRRDLDAYRDAVAAHHRAETEKAYEAMLLASAHEAALMAKLERAEAALREIVTAGDGMQADRLAHVRDIARRALAGPSGGGNPA